MLKERDVQAIYLNALFVSPLGCLKNAFPIILSSFSIIIIATIYEMSAMF